MSIERARIQNFARRQATIITADQRLLPSLQNTLAKLGVQIRLVSSQTTTLLFDDYPIDRNVDVLFLDGDLSGNVNIPRFCETALPLIPVIGMVGSEAPSRLGRLMNNGATTFIKKPIYADAVFSTLFMAINTHHEKTQLAQRIHTLEERRHARRYVIKAVTLVMQQFSVDDEEAYNLLRRHSMNEQCSIEHYAQQLVQQHERTLG